MTAKADIVPGTVVRVKNPYNGSINDHLMLTPIGGQYPFHSLNVGDGARLIVQSKPKRIQGVNFVEVMIDQLGSSLHGTKWWVYYTHMRYCTVKE